MIEDPILGIESWKESVEVTKDFDLTSPFRSLFYEAFQHGLFSLDPYATEKYPTHFLQHQ